ncbi:MAG: DUF1553 domain-containing protein [Bryobacteraceae bacterium]
MTSVAVATDGDVVRFNRDIRPILSDKCYTCHGPDEQNRKTRLRFDTEEGAKADLGGRFAIVAGDPDKSELIRRVTTSNRGLRMPPLATGHSVDEREVALLRRWIEQGAKWEKHWSFISPERPAPPAISNSGWAKNEIDHFVAARLEREGLHPSPEASRTALIRRVSLDLTGIPPTPAEVDAFVNDPSPNAYEKVIDRLLASPRYGERMAARWLDAARYADTNGYQTDAERFMWRWRDWVIDAFNRNMPFDRFTIEQIAGDMLPNATLDQKIASGFNRNHRGNGEGGIIPEEYQVEYVVDRVETTSAVWLGLTMGCARCHDHKYDPLSQKEFYRVYAYFNNVPERGKVFKYGNTPPLVQAPTPEQEQKLQALDKRLADAEHRFASLRAEAGRAQRSWEKSLKAAQPADWAPEFGLAARFALDGDVAGVSGRGESLKAEFSGGAAEFAPGRIAQAARLDGKRFVSAGNVGNYGFFDKFTLAAWIYAESKDGAIVTRAEDLSEGKGYGLYLEDGKLQFNLVVRWLDDSLRVATEADVPLNRWVHVAASYDASRVSEGVRLYIDGKPQKLNVHLDELNQSFNVRAPLRIGADGSPEHRFRGLIDDVRVYNAVLSEEEAAILARPEPLHELARVKPDARTGIQQSKLRLAFLDRFAPEPIRTAWHELSEARRARRSFVESLPTVMVMEEMDKPRDTFLLLRGAYDRPGEKVTPGVPSALPPLPDGLPNNRLGFAKWLVDSANPLTARVTVNRFWQMYFGVGLVKTVEDFGSQGEWPTHPELLDWLATEFIRTGWDVKAIQKTIVMSATYRQESKVSPELIQRDPENRLLARGPRVRLPAEAVRDQALAASGLLVENIGGPSVKPYQPAGLWKELSGGADYIPDTGDKLYRRSIYTFWKRAAPPPTLMTFDAAGRETCVVRESRTNTPLQALALMNDVTFVEAARAMAQRMMVEGGVKPEERIEYGFRLVTARRPNETEQSVLIGHLRHQLDLFQTHPQGAAKLIAQGESKPPASLGAPELAAYTSVASLILNLDEAVNKE